MRLPVTNPVIEPVAQTTKRTCQIGAMGVSQAQMLLHATLTPVSRHPPMTDAIPRAMFWAGFHSSLGDGIHATGSIMLTRSRP